MLKTHVPHFHFTVTKEHLRRKLQEHGPTKPAAFMKFVYEQENQMRERDEDGEKQPRSLHTGGELHI